MRRTGRDIAIGNDGRGWMVVRVSPGLAEYYESMASHRGITLSQMSEFWLRSLRDADCHIRMVARRRPSMRAKELARGLGKFLASAAIALDALPDVIDRRQSQPRHHKRRLGTKVC